MIVHRIKKKHFTIKGDKDVIKNLNRAIRGIKGNAKTGILAAIHFVKNKSQDLAPVDEGVLMNSAFAKMAPTKAVAKNKIYGVSGFTAKYAANIHEKAEKGRGLPRSGKGSKGNYWDGGENKFLLKAVTRNISSILNLIKRFASRKPA